MVPNGRQATRRQVIDTHDNHHAQIDQLLEKAKKD